MMTPSNIKPEYGTSIRRSCLAAAAACALLLLTAAAMGQINDPSVSTENIELLPPAKPVVEYALAGAFLLGAMAVGFRPGKSDGPGKKGASAPP